MVVSKHEILELSTQRGFLRMEIKHKSISISHWYKCIPENFCPIFVQLHQLTIRVSIITNPKSDIFGPGAQSVLDYFPHTIGGKICVAEIKDDIHVR